MVTDLNTDLAQQAQISGALEQLDIAAGDTRPQVSSNIDKGAKVTLVSMVDGLPRPPIPRMHAERALAKRLPDGRPAFWIPGMQPEPPKPIRGSIKCYFHPEFDETDGPAGFARDFLVQAGLESVTCNMNARDKKNRDDFPNVFLRDQHAAAKHPSWWKALQGLIDKRQALSEKEERDLDRDLIRDQQAAILALAGGKPTETADSAVHLEYLNADGLRAYADARGIELSNRQSVTVMRTEIEAAS